MHALACAFKRTAFNGERQETSKNVGEKSVLLKKETSCQEYMKTFTSSYLFIFIYYFNYLFDVSWKVDFVNLFSILFQGRR